MAKCKLTGILVILTLIAILSGCVKNKDGPISTTLFSENFEGYTDGEQLPDPPWIANGFIPQITTDGSKVLQAQTGGSIFYNNGYSWTNYTFSLRLKKQNSGVFGIYFRKQSGDSRSYCVELTGGTTLTLWLREADGTLNSLTQINDVNYSTDTYYSLKVTVKNNNIKVYFNNATTPQIDCNDSTYTSGTIGLSTENFSTSYDDLIVTAL